MSGCFSDRSAAAPAEPRRGLVLEATSWTGNRQSRAALGAKAPRRRVFGHAAWAAHLEPWPLETIGFEHISGLIAEEANISSSRVLTSPRYRRVLRPPRRWKTGLTPQVRQPWSGRNPKIFTRRSRSRTGTEIRLGRTNCSMPGETRSRSVGGAPWVLRVIAQGIRVKNLDR